MIRIKIGIALISMFGLLLGSASIANSVPNYKVPQVRTSHATKSSHHQALSKTSKLTVQKSAKSVKSTKPVKSAKHLKD